MTQNTLMFEVGIDLAKGQLEHIKSQIASGVTDIKKLLELQVTLKGVDDVIQQLNKIGDNRSLRNLREEVESLNRQFALLSKGAGGTGDLATRGISQEIEKQRQSLERYTSELKELETRRKNLPGGKYHVGYSSLTSDIEQTQLKIEGVKSSIQKLESELSNASKVGPNSIKPIDESISQLKKHIDEVSSRHINISLGTDFGKWIQDVQLLTSEVKALVEQFKHLNVVKQENVDTATIKAQREEISSLESRVKSLREEAERLQLSIKQTSEGIKTVASGRGSEATQNSNLDTVRSQTEKVTAALEKMHAEYARMESSGAQNASLRERIALLVQYKKHLDEVAKMDLSKSGALKATSLNFNGQMLFGQMNKQMYSDKSVKEFSKLVDETIKAKNVADSLNDAFERMKQKMLGIGSSASGGMRGVSTTMESITKVGELNIQTLIREQGHIERLMAMAQKSISFADSHPVAGMGDLASQQRANLQYLQNVKDAIDHILAHRQEPEWMRFLNTAQSLRIPLPGSGNDIALLGGHFDQLVHNVVGASTSMRQLQKDMQLDDKGLVAAQRAAERLQQSMSNAEVASGKNSEAAAKAVSDLNRRFQELEISQLRAKAVKAGIDVSEYDKAILTLQRYQKALEFTKVNGGYGADWILGSSSFRDAQNNLAVQTKALIAGVSADKAYMREVERYTEESKKAFIQAEKEKAAAAAKAEKERLTTMAQSEKKIQSELSATQKLYDKLGDSIAKGKNAGRDMSVLENQQSKILGQMNVLKHLSESDKQNAALIEKRIKNVQDLRNETDRLKKSEDELTKIRERLNKKQDDSALKRLRDEEESVKRAAKEYDNLVIKITELKALRQRGLDAHIDVSKLDVAIIRYEKLRDLMAGIYNNRGRVNNSSAGQFFSLNGSNALTSEVLSHRNVQTNLSLAKGAVDEYKVSLADVESRMKRAATSATTLDKKAQALEARKMDFTGLDTSRLDNAIQKIRAIQAELEKFSKTGQSSFGTDASSIAKSMGVATAYNEARVALNNLNHEQKSAANVANQLSSEEQKLAQALSHSTGEMNKQSQVLSDLKMMATQYLSVWGAQSFLHNIIETGGLLEQQRLSIGSILGNTAQANELFSRIKGLAVQSPFGVVELDRFSKQLTAYNFQYHELYDMTKRLADVSAATGTDVSRLALALGHVRSEGALTGYTLRQFAMNNVPMLTKLSERLSEIEGRVVSAGDVRNRVRNKEISYQDVEAVIKELTDAGGMFYNAQEVMSQALNAKFKNLRDSFDIMYGEIAESGIGDVLKGVAMALTDMSKNWQLFIPLVKVGALGLASYKMSMVVLNTAMGKNLVATRASILSYKQKRAEELKLASVTRVLTTEEKNLVATSNVLTASDIRGAMAAGVLDKAEVLRLVTLKRLSAEEARQLVQLNLITEAEYYAASGASRLSVAWRMMWTNIKTGVASIGRFLFNGWNMALLGLTAYMELSQKNDEYEQSRAERINALSEKSREGVRNLQEVTKSYAVGMSDSLDETGLTNAIDEMVEKLKNYSVDANKVINEAFSTGHEIKLDGTSEDAITNVHTLAEQYEILAQAVHDTELAYAELDKIKNLVDASYDMTQQKSIFGFVNPFDKDLKGEVKEYSLAVKEYELAQVELLKHRSELNDILRERAGISNADSLGSKEIISVLENLRDNSSQIYREIYQSLDSESKNALNRWSESGREWRSQLASTYTEAYKFGDELRSKLTARWGDDVSKWPSYWGQTVKMAFDSTLADTAEFANMSIEEQNRIRNAFLEPFGIKVDNTEAKDRINEVVEQMNALVGKTWTIKLGIQGTSSMDDIDAIEKNVKKYRATIDKLGQGLRNKGIVDSKGNMLTSSGLIYDNVLRQDAKEYEDAQEGLKKAEQALGAHGLSLPEDKTKNKKTGKGSGGTKKDTQLEEARTYLEEVKSFLSEYKKYRDIYGESRSISILEELFPTTKGKGTKIVNEYKDILKQIKNGLPLNSEERKKFAISIDKLIADTDYDNMKRQVDEAAKEMQEYINLHANQFNLFDQIMKKTGDRNLAERAFADGRLWDDAARLFDKKLRDVSGQSAIDYTMSDQAAQDYFKRVSGGYELWKKIVDITRKNYTDGLTNAADALEKMMTTEEKILKAEQDIERLRSEGKHAEAQAKERDVLSLRKQSFEESEDYLRFYAAPLSLAKDELERLGNVIKQNLLSQFRNGVLDARQYTKAIRDVNNNLQKGRESFSGDIMTFLSSGMKGIIEKREQSFADAAIKVQQAERDVEKAAKDRNREEFDAANRRLLSAQKEMDVAAKQLGVSVQTMRVLSNISEVVQIITGALDGFHQVASSLSEMFDALGKDDLANTWSDIADGISVATKMLEPASNVMQNAMSGNIGGTISGVISAPIKTITGPITALAQLHDKKLNRAIERSVRKVKELQDVYSAMTSEIGRRLTGIYGGDEYSKMLDNYKQQLTELESQRESESRKKKSDKDKLLDYDTQIREMNETIKYFAEDMAKDLYNIDFKSWSKELTDAVVDAWTKGEDAAKAWHDKVQSLVQDVTKNILAQRIVEKAMEEPLEFLTREMTIKNGKLDAGSISRLAELLNDAGTQSVDAITATLEALKRAGYDMSDSTSSSSVSNSIKGISENTADLLASYINAIRADVSMNRELMTQSTQNLSVLPGMNITVQAQLQSLSLISQNTLRTADNTARIEDLYNVVRNATINKGQGFWIR